MMSKCRRVEDYDRCDQMRRYSPERKDCSEIKIAGDCGNTYHPSGFFGTSQILCQWDEGRGICTTSAEHCSDW